MSTALRLSELYNLSPVAKADRLAALVQQRNRPVNGELAELTSRVAEYETRYEMSSEIMREQVGQNTLRETAEIGHWLILLELRDRLAAKAR